MFNKNFRKDKHFSTTGFRYRGVEGSRIEQLTDAVFAFAITLLVIASEVPKTYVELQASMYGFIGFIACVLLLFGIWSNHSLFFLQYGLQDRATKVFNFLFLFILLFYIYPLKYLFSLAGAMLLFPLIKRDSEPYRMALEKVKAAALSLDQWQDLIVRFGLGLLLIYGIFMAMHYNALRKKEEIELNEQEVYETKFHILNYFFLVLISCMSVVYVLIRGGLYSGSASAFYLLIPTVLPFVKMVYLKKLKKKFPDAFQEQKIFAPIESKEIEAEPVKQKAPVRTKPKTTPKRKSTAPPKQVLTEKNKASKPSSTQVNKPKRGRKKPPAPRTNKNADSSK